VRAFPDWPQSVGQQVGFARIWRSYNWIVSEFRRIRSQLELKAWRDAQFHQLQSPRLRHACSNLVFSSMICTWIWISGGHKYKRATKRRARLRLWKWILVLRSTTPEISCLRTASVAAFPSAPNSGDASRLGYNRLAAGKSITVKGRTVRCVPRAPHARGWSWCQFPSRKPPPGGLTQPASIKAVRICVSAICAIQAHLQGSVVCGRIGFLSPTSWKQLLAPKADSLSVR